MMRIRKTLIPKINSIGYGGIWIYIGLVIGLIIPTVIWFVTDKFIWVFCCICGVILVAFVIMLSIELHQDNGKIPYYIKTLKQNIPFDEEQQYAVIHASICTGEKVAGFKNKCDGHFTEVLVIKSDEDLELFKKIYGINDIKKEY